LLERSQIPYGKVSEITKGLSSPADVPELRLTFLIAGIPREEHVQETDELTAVGKLECDSREIDDY